jgi:hypothetical protein
LQEVLRGERALSRRDGRAPGGAGRAAGVKDDERSSRDPARRRRRARTWPPGAMANSEKKSEMEPEGESGLMRKKQVWYSSYPLNAS